MEISYTKSCHTFVFVHQDSTPVMTKIYSTLGRKFNKKDLEEAMRMGEEMVRGFDKLFLL